MLMQRNTSHADTFQSTNTHALAVRVGSHLDPGIRRRLKPNEDTLLVVRGVMPSASPAAPPKPFVLLVVADGMGGQGHGQEASQLAARTMVEYVSGYLYSQQKPFEEWLPLLTAGVQLANQVVHERNQEQKTVMGTTMTAALVSEGMAYVAHVGDSRLYRYRASTGLAQLTHDHSLVAALVEEGIIAPGDIYTHPRRNLIYRSLGAEASVEVDALSLQLAADDMLLLCSDGLWEMVRDAQIAAILTAPASSPSATADALIQAALAGGGEDNVSAIVVQVSKA